MSTTDNDAQTWRDLLGDLTPEQIAELEYIEAHQTPRGLCEPHSLLDRARVHIRHNLAQAMCAGIAPPADCVGEPFPWQEWDTNLWQRSYSAFSRTVGAATVEIVGSQYSDGTVERGIYINGEAEGLDAASARKLAAALTEAAERLDAIADADAARRAQDAADAAWSAVPVDSTLHPCCRGVGRHGQDCEEEPPFM